MLLLLLLLHDSGDAAAAAVDDLVEVELDVLRVAPVVAVVLLLLSIKLLLL